MRGEKETNTEERGETGIFFYGEKGKALNKCYLRGEGEMGGKILRCQNVCTFICPALDLKLEYIQYSFLAKKSVYCERVS